MGWRLGRSWAPALAALALAVAAGAAEDPAELVDGIAAQVGGESVLISDVRNLVGPMEARFRQMGASETDIAKLRADALERLIERALIRQVIRRAELEATEVEIDSAIAAIAEENDLTLQQLIATVEAEGLPYVTYRERIRGEIEQSKVLQGMVASRVRLEERDVEAAYHKRFDDQPKGGSELHLRHVLLPFLSDDPGDRRLACQQAEQAREQLALGEGFESIVDDLPREAAQTSRDLGWIHESSLASWMAAPVLKAEVGGVTDVIQTDFGCNVLQVVDRRKFEPRTFAEVHDELYDQLFAEKMQEQYLQFMNKLRDRTYIERKGVFAEATRLGETLPKDDGPGRAGP